jgi:Spy/CpxP family protein refolding chaperone
MRSTLLAFALAAAALPSAAQHGHGQHHGQGAAASPYAGQQSRDIKALSEQEVRDLLAGAGMGMAKAAELNRYPGPMHALELAEPLGLSAEQRERLTSLMQRHKSDARKLGERVVALERELDALFARGKPSPAEVDRLSVAIGEAQGRLRADHLKTHLETTSLLTPAQVEAYVKARGYQPR